MTSSRKISVMMYTGLVGVALLKGEDEFKTFETLESAGMIAILDEDEQEAYQVLKRNKLIQQPIIEKHGGKMLGYKDHRILSQFSSALDAVECADTIIRVCENEQDVKIRVGIHLGEFSFIDNEVSEGGLAFVSALETVAPVGCILASEPVHANILNRKGIVSSIFESNVSTNVEADLKVFQVAVMGKDHILPDKPSLRHRLYTFVRQKSKVIIALTALLLIASYLLYSNYSSDQHTAPSITAIDKSIVVLPFVNISQDPEQEYFSDGMTEEVLNHLSKIEDLKVISRTTAMQYKGTTKSVNQITKELNVATALEGSVRKDGIQVRITVQLVEGETDTQLWSKSYDRELTKIFEVQSDVAQRIAQVLAANITPEVRLKIESPPTTNVGAYNRYLQAKAQVIAGSHLAGIKLFEEVIDMDPEFANAYTELGFWKTVPWREDVYLQPFDPIKAVRIAAPYYNKALEIDPDNLAAHDQKARMHLWYEWDFEAAEKEVIIMKRLNPTSSLPGLLLATGRFDEYLKGSEKVLEVDPLDPYQWAWKILGLYFTDQHDRALETIEEAKNLHDIIIDQSGLYTLAIQSAHVYSYLGMYKEAISTLEKHNVGLAMGLSVKAIAYFHLGQADKSYRLIEEIKTTFGKATGLNPSTYLAMIYAQMGEVNTAFEWLEKAYEDHEYWICWIKWQPFFKPLHNDPRWQEILDKVGFPD